MADMSRQLRIDHPGAIPHQMDRPTVADGLTGIRQPLFVSPPEGEREKICKYQELTPLREKSWKS
jgi:hypothetical protein